MLSSVGWTLNKCCVVKYKFLPSGPLGKGPGKLGGKMWGSPKSLAPKKGGKRWQSSRKCEVGFVSFFWVWICGVSKNSTFLGGARFIKELAGMTKKK